MNNFKVGDLVQCVNVDNIGVQLTYGQVYLVIEEDDIFTRVVNDMGENSGYQPYRFRLYQTQKKTMPEIIDKSVEQHIKEFLNKLEYVLDKDNTTFGRIECWQHKQGVIVIPTDVVDIIGVDDIYTYINNSYDQLTSQAAQKRKQELLDKKAKLDVELAQVNSELEGL